MKGRRSNIVEEWVLPILMFLFNWVGGLTFAIFLAKGYENYWLLCFMAYWWIALFFEMIAIFIPQTYQKSEIKFFERYKYCIKVLLIFTMAITGVLSKQSFLMCSIFSFICISYHAFIRCYSINDRPPKEDKEARELYEKLVWDGKVKTTDEKYETIKIRYVRKVLNASSIKNEKNNE